MGELIIFSPISPNADRNLVRPLGFCDEEFRMSVSHDSSGLMWDLSDFGSKNIIMTLSIHLSLLLHSS